jgi:RNA polymerase sigma factor (sigma-70 family)
MEKLEDALERIYRQYRQQLFTCALSVTRRPERAEDAIHDAFCRLPRLNRKPRHLKPYVFRAVRNAAIDQLRRNPLPHDEASEFIFEPNEGPSERASRKEFKEQVSDSMLTLSENQRETIVQHLYAGLTFREIARLRKTSLSTVAAWYYRGLKKLRAQLEDSHA